MQLNTCRMNCTISNKIHGAYIVFFKIAIKFKCHVLYLSAFKYISHALYQKEIKYMLRKLYQSAI